MLLLRTVLTRRPSARASPSATNNFTYFLVRHVQFPLKTKTQTSPEGNPLPVGKGNTFFTYDRIFDEDSSTQEVYEGVAQEIVHSVVRGLNGTIFAYGQTSSGKTFTMQGDGENTKTPGIVQMAARDLFDLMGESQNRVFLMRVSYLEIYQEEIRDLLNPESPQTVSYTHLTLPTNREV